jgi:PKD repeat protein
MKVLVMPVMGKEESMKRTASALTLILALLVLLLAGVQTVKAPYTSDVDTTATIVAIPDPIGVGQIIKFIGDINPNPPTSPLGFRDISIIINYPDGSNVTLGPFISNAAGEVTTKFVPTIVGVYSMRFTFLGGTLSDGHYYQPYEAATNFTVQPESIWGPVGSFTFDPTAPEVDETVTFDASNSSDPDGTILNHSWNFGDGTTENQTGGVTTIHSYTLEGSYNVTLTVKDNDQLTNTTTKSITVNPPPKEAPEASFTYSLLDPEANETVTFDASGSSDTDGTISNCFWDFGDGTTGAGITATHSYTLNGTYTVTLTVTDNDALTDITRKTIINVIPEFPSWTILPLLLTATLLILIYKKRLPKTPEN